MTGTVIQPATIRNSSDLSVLLQSPAAGSDLPLGELLIKHRQLAPQQLSRVLRQQEQARQRQNGLDPAASGSLRLGDLLVEHGLVAPEQIKIHLALKFGIPYVKLDDNPVSSEVIARIPAQICLQHHILPLAVIDGRLVVAVDDPWDNHGIDLLRFQSGLSIVPVMASSDDINLLLGRVYSQHDEDAAMLDRQGQSGEPTYSRALQLLEQQANQKPIVRLLNSMVLQAMLRQASDIHIRPQADSIMIYYRIDGRLQWIRSLNKALHTPLLNRAKILGQLDIAERRLPQDGHALIKRGQHHVDLRLSIIPTVHGESLVIRVLDQHQGIRRLSALGVGQRQRAQLQQLCQQQSGLFLVVGPTGSGKTSTLYSLLEEIRRDGRHILTVEDPVEYSLEGIEQVQINTRKGVGFSNVLRHFLRHDPDVIMVGEIRDKETAQLAVRAALTGHLVLSTLHTHDAPATVSRLLNMGIEPYLLSATLRGVMAQRLLRQNCPHCTEAINLDVPLARRLGLGPATIEQQGQGCHACHNTGYHGRTIISEILSIDDGLAEAINQSLPLVAFKNLALEHGWVPMMEQGLAQVAAGKTTLAELMSVCDDAMTRAIN